MSLETEQVSTEDVAVSNKATRKHIRGSSMLLVGRMLSLGMNFVVQVLTVRYLTKGDYGAFAYALNIASMGSSVSLFSLDKALSRYLPIYDEHKEYPSLYGAIFLTLGSVLGLGVALGMLVLAFEGLIRERFVSDPLAVSLLLILIWLSPIYALDNWFQSMFAVFARVRAIFFRRYILGPGLKLAAVLVVIVAHADVYSLAWGYLFGGVLGGLAYAAMLVTVMRQRQLFKNFDRQALRLPFRDIFTFSTPMMYSDVVFILRNNLTVVFLEFFHNTIRVAEFRAVVPVARLNHVVMESFTFLYTPLAARMFAKKDDEGVDDLYWQTAVWISIMSFPVFVVSFSLAKPLTVLLFGDRYANSSTILALLSLGHYFNAALGFNAHTLRVYGKIKYTVVIDFLAMCVALGLNLLLIPPYGAIGAAYSASGTLIIHNLLNHTGLLFGTPIHLFNWKYLRTYVVITIGAISLLLFQVVVDPPIFVSLPLAALVSLGIIRANRAVLNVADMFPELMKIPFVKKLLA